MHAVAIAPDGTWLATGGADVRIWDLASGVLRATLTGHARPVTVTRLAIAPDGSWLATDAGRPDGVVRIWDVATEQQREVIGAFSASVLAREHRPGRHLAGHHQQRPAGGADLGRSYRTRVRYPYRPDRVRALAIAPEGTWLAAVSGDGTARIWDPAARRIGAVMRVEQLLNDCAWSPSGQMIAVAGDGGVYGYTFKP